MVIYFIALFLKIEFILAFKLCIETATLIIPIEAAKEVQPI